MAATVLGKRSRKVLDTEDVANVAPSPKRRTRRSVPEIYEDASPESAGQETNTSPVTTRNRRSQRTVQDSPVNLVHNDTRPFDENLPPSDVSTPTAARFKDVFAVTPSTPKHRVRLAGGLLTPRSSRSSTPKSQNVYSRGRQLFTQASNGKIIGREAERSQLRKFIFKALDSKTGGCTYVSGPPGTGKSALVQEIIHESSEQHVRTAIVNCVSLKSSSEALVQLSNAFCSTKSNAKSSKTSLAKLFTTKKANSSMYLVLLDEIDTLLHRDCDVLYSIFEWAMHPSSCLILIGIANALDLTDRFLPRLKLRNVKPQLLSFLPYSAQQISTIICEKLRSLVPDGTAAGSEFIPLMHPAAVQLAGKKISSQTGDLRKAFSLVRRAIDQIEQETLLKVNQEQSITPTKTALSEIRNMGSTTGFPSPLRDQRSVLGQLTFETAPRATIAHVAKIAASIFNNGTISRLSGLNLQQKAVLCSLVASENRRFRRDPYTTPSKSWSKVPTVKELFEKYAALCKRDEGLLQPLKNTEFRDVVASLETLGLVQEASGRTSSLLTPTNTPSRSGRGAMDDKQVVSAVSEGEMRDSLTGPGSDLLLRLLDEE
ncbi:Cell division control protein 18 [Cladophialophora carrionii]|uniref:Cell division control protein n=1 Tax=Cladophialophora carrionii TaxID=86049 RepID=A0A1C1CDH4_9EURO|nr:Cell division control protein 18 [Cladophialophora carrionii]